MNIPYAQHMVRTSLLTGLAAAFLATSATAATVSFSDTKSVGVNSSDFLLGKFDTGLGTLTAVEIKVDSSTLAGSVTVTSKSASTVTVTAFDAALTVSDPSLTNDLGFNETTARLFTVVTSPIWKGAGGTKVSGNSSQVYTIVGGQSYTFSAQNISSDYFTAYESVGGVGAVDIQAINVATIGASGGTYEVDPTATVANTKMTVTYTYDAVPEPTTIGLLAVAGGVILLAVRRRRA